MRSWLRRGPTAVPFQLVGAVIVLLLVALSARQVAAAVDTAYAYDAHDVVSSAPTTSSANSAFAAAAAMAPATTAARAPAAHHRLPAAEGELPPIAGGSGEIPTGSMPPPAALRQLARETGISRGALSDAFHAIKRAGGLGPADSTRIDPEGNVYDAETGENLGNVIDEASG